MSTAQGHLRMLVPVSSARGINSKTHEIVCCSGESDMCLWFYKHSASVDESK